MLLQCDRLQQCAPQQQKGETMETSLEQKRSGITSRSLTQTS